MREPAAIIQIQEKSRARGLISSALALIAIVGVGGALAYVGFSKAQAKLPSFSSSEITVKPTPEILKATRALARLETTQIEIEKVVDLSDEQHTLFGLVDTKDAMLLVASGEATVGIDLEKLKDGDVSYDPVTQTAKFRLPAPEIFSASLDEDKTYVYSRKTDTLASRNEHLEGEARKKAVDAIRNAAKSEDIMRKARDQAEKALTTLAVGLGAKKAEFSYQK